MTSDAEGYPSSMVQRVHRVGETLDVCLMVADELNVLGRGGGLVLSYGCAEVRGGTHERDGRRAKDERADPDHHESFHDLN